MLLELFISILKNLDHALTSSKVVIVLSSSRSSIIVASKLDDIAAAKVKRYILKLYGGKLNKTANFYPVAALISLIVCNQINSNTIENIHIWYPYV